MVVHDKSTNPIIYLTRWYIPPPARPPHTIMSEFKLAPRSRSPLLHEDLFYAIFDVLAEPTNPSPFDMGIPFATPDPDARCALAVLARTCRTFTQPCLDRLWRRLTSLEPLLWCYTSLEVILGSQLQVGEVFLRLEMISDLTSVVSISS